MDAKASYTHFMTKMDFDALDEKLRRFVILRNEMIKLAEEIGIEVKTELLELVKQ